MSTRPCCEACSRSTDVFLFPFSPGSLSILKPLDREEQENYNLTIVAEDHGIPQHSTTQVLSIQVIDVNDEAPWFELSEFEAQIKENQPAETSILKVSASDRDHGEWFSIKFCNNPCVKCSFTTEKNQIHFRVFQPFRYSWPVCENFAIWLKQFC